MTAGVTAAPVPKAIGGSSLAGHTVATIAKEDDKLDVENVLSGLTMLIVISAR